MAVQAVSRPTSRQNKLDVLLVRRNQDVLAGLGDRLILPRRGVGLIGAQVRAAVSDGGRPLRRS
jgi:hypothetical protein